MNKKYQQKENEDNKTYIKPEVKVIRIKKESIIMTSGEFPCCVLEGTPIVMGDGSTKKVEDLRFGDSILAFNFFNGRFESTPLLYTFVQSGIADKFDISLENGNKITILNDEDMFDTNTKEFFTVDLSTYKQCIGKVVLVNNNGQIGKSKIINISYEKKECSFYTLYSKKVNNYVANNIVLMYAKNGFSQKYKIDNSYKVDMDDYNENVKKHGLFNYDDLPNLTHEMVDDFDIASSKFLIGKGYITKEQFDELMNKFIEEYNTKRPLFLKK